MDNKPKSNEYLDWTIPLMQSEAYVDRFVAEYWQTKLRYDRLHDTIVRIEAGTIDFKPACSLELLKQQAACMGNYLYALELRAEREGIRRAMLTLKSEEARYEWKNS